MSVGADPVIPLNAVYRIVWTDPPTVEDFLSDVDRGIEPRRPLPAESVQLLSGISVYRTPGQARRTARKVPPWLGRDYIARLVIPLGASVRLERTTKSAGHYTIWADAEDLLSRDERVEPVTPRNKGDHGP